MESQEGLQEEIRQYEFQLNQVLLAVNSSPDGPERDNLLTLQNDLQELISLTRENLNKLQVPSTNKKNVEVDPFEAEYALFKAEIANEEEEEEESTVKADESESSTSAFDSNTLSEELQQLQGMPCQAPHLNHDNDMSYHNAFVCGVELNDQVSAIEQIKVRVMFTNPTQNSMLPCPYFLEGECRFSTEKCRFSHGELVNLSDLKEFCEPDFSVVQKGACVLVKNNKDNLWHRAIIIDRIKTKCQVKMENGGKKMEIELENVLPLENINVNNTASYLSDSDSDDDGNDDDDDDEGEVVFVDASLIQQSLMTTPPNSRLGDWEKHTRGIGSKLMAQMGYITGTGLGKDSKGRLEPVEALVLPQGKSLDHCMHLKEQAGANGESLFSAERRLRLIQKKQARQQIQMKQTEERRRKNNIFDFLNSRLALVKKSTNEKEIKKQAAQLKTETNKGLNVASLQLSEQIRKAEREAARLRQGITRQPTSSGARCNLEKQLAVKEEQIRGLRVSEKSVAREKAQRAQRDKLAIF